MTMLLLSVAFANALDLVTFLLAVRRFGIGGEANPIVRHAWDVAGPLGVVGLKALGVLLIVALLGLLPASWRGPVVLGAVLVAAAGAATNIRWAMA